MEEEVGRRVGPSSNSGDSPGPANQASEVWKLLGRDTPGGKALFNIYGGNATGRNAGQQYHERNKTVHDKKMASGWAPKPLESPKIEVPRPQVNYPKFGGPKYNVDPGAARLRAIPRRKQAEVILKELREEEERLRALPPPRPRGPLLDEKEKARLAELMRFRGRVPDVTPEDRAEAARHRGAASKPRTRREELQRMFDAVSDEVEERRTFLQEMEALGALTRDHVHQIHAEIKLRVADMQRIDRLLQQEAGDE